MADASFVQDAFTGGEWSPYAQGRITDKRYRTAMETCLNGTPMEEGAWVRRPGTAFLCTTRNGAYGRVLPFDFNDTAPFNIEVTDAHLRLLAGRSLVFDSVAAVVGVDDQDPAILSHSGNDDWVTGDQVVILFTSGPVAGGAILRNRVLEITVINDNQFTMADPITGDVVGADVNWDPLTVAQVARVLDFDTPYAAADLPLVRRVQAAGVGVNQSDVAIMLSPVHQPCTLTATLNLNTPTFSTFSFGTLGMQDGPYLDPPVGATLVPSGTASPFNVTIAYQTYSSTTAYQISDFVTYSGLIYQSNTEGNINNQPDTNPADWTNVNLGAAVGLNGFQAGDLGRLIRMLSEPSVWNAGAGYAAGDKVAYNNAYYVAQQANSGAQPDTSLDNWVPTTSTAVAAWVWGRISEVVSDNEVEVTLLGTTQALLYNLPIRTFRAGVYSDAAGWPSCGAYYAGRLWLGGVIPNRFDASFANDPFNFSPTAPDGTVGDANAIVEYFNSDDKNTLYWMEPTASGLLCGTKKGEWLISASNLKDPITPTSIQADRVTKVGCANVLPAHTPLSMVIVQRFSRLLFEVFPDLFSGKLTAPNLNRDSKHLTKPGVAEVAYQSELAPIVWARNNDGSLVGWTYRRRSAQSAADPEIIGGHRHVFGNGRTVVSLCVNSTPDQTSDAPVLVTVDEAGVHHIEQMTQFLDPQDALTSGWFVDDGSTPSGIVTDATGVTLYGLWHLNGSTISVVCGGLDLGDHLVTNGSLHVNYGADSGGLFTLAFLQALDADTYGDLATTADTTVETAAGSVSAPMVIRAFGPPINDDTFITTVAKMDYANNKAWMEGSTGFHKVSLTNFTDTLFVDYATIAASAAGGLGVDLAWDFAVGFDGFIYARQVGSNQSPWIKVNPATATVVGTFGANSNFWSGGSGGFGAPLSMTTLQVNGTNYVIGGNMVSAFTRTINWLNGDSMTYVPGGAYIIEAGFGIQIVRGPMNADGGTVYAISTPETLNFSPGHLTLYQSSVSAVTGVVTTSVLGTITPDMFDPEWGFFNSVYMGIDQRDGNLLIGVSSGTFPVTTLTNYNYIAKVRASDMSVIWKTPLAVGASMNECRASHGLLSWIGGNNVYVLNTVDGSYTSFPIFNVIPNGLQISDDDTGILYTFASYATAVNPDNPRPYPGTPSAFNGFNALTAGDIFHGAVTSTTSVTVPAVAGFTYTSQGRIVRPALPAEAGAANGPAAGKTRRSHMFTALLAAAVYGAISFGTVFGKLRPANFKRAGGDPYATNALYSGVFQSTLEDNYSFEGGLAWEITRPLPASISSVGGFIQTQDR